MRRVLYFVILSGLVVTGLMLNAKSKKNTNDGNTELFLCARVFPTAVFAIFSSEYFINYSRSTVILAKNDQPFYAFVRSVEKGEKIKKTEYAELILAPSGDWIDLKSLPEAQQANWPGIDKFFTENEKGFLWTCAQKQKGFRLT